MHRQYFMFILLLLFLFDAFGEGDSQTDPVIKYTCDASFAKIKSFGMTGGTFDHIRIVSKTEYCEPTYANETGVIECISSLQLKSAEHKLTGITILYEDLTHAGIIGGANIKYYKLDCKEHSGSQIAILEKIDVVPLSSFKPTEVYLDIITKPTFTIKNKPATIHVGTKIILQLEIKAKYTLLPETCSAYLNMNGDNQYRFWTKCDKSNNDKAIMPDLLWKITKENGNTKATIEMFAFRYTQSSSVIIQCETLVCTSGNQECIEQACPARKKRDAYDLHTNKKNVTTETASITYDVFENQYRENDSHAFSPVLYLYAIGFGIVYWITVKTF